MVCTGVTHSVNNSSLTCMCLDFRERNIPVRSTCLSISPISEPTFIDVFSASHGSSIRPRACACQPLNTLPQFLVELPNPPGELEMQVISLTRKSQAVFGLIEQHCPPCQKSGICNRFLCTNIHETAVSFLYVPLRAESNPWFPIFSHDMSA